MNKVYSIEFLRIYMCLIICFGHLLNLILVQLDRAYEILHINCYFLCVEAFFIISGFFLCLSKKSLKDNIKSRFITLWPLYAFSIAVAGILRTFHVHYYSLSLGDLWNLLFLQGTGIYQGCGLNGPAWYICVLFWCSLLFLIIKKSSIKKQITFVSLISLISLILLWVPKSDIIYSNTRGFIPHTIISVMIARGLASMGIGYLFGCIQKHILSLEKYKSLLKNNKFIFTILEGVLLICFSWIIFYGYTTLSLINNYFILLLLLLFVNNVGYVSSKLLNKNLITFCGKYSYSIYIMQNVVFFIILALAKCNMNIVNNHRIFTIIFCMLLFVIVGITAFYIVNYILNLFIERKIN